MLNDLLGNLLLLALASGQVVETYRHGSVFKPVRDWADRQQDTFLGKLLHCPFCFSHHPAWVILLLWWLVPWFQFVVWWLAVTRLSQLINDLCHDKNRSPVREEELQPLGDDNDQPINNS